MESGRETFRMEVRNVSGLSVELRRSNTYVSVIPITLSLTGIYVEPSRGDWLNLTKGEEVEVIMDFEGKNLTQPAIVQRCESSGYALRFGGAKDAKTNDPPPEIRQFVMELQRRWLEQHKQ